MKKTANDQPNAPLAKPCVPAVAGVVILAFVSTAAAEVAARPPNIIFMLCDDHRWDAMGNMGHPFLQTPNLDRMVSRGLRCENSYVTTSLCSPSRASILTGMYTHNHGVADNYHPVNSSLKFFPEYLQAAGTRRHLSASGIWAIWMNHSEVSTIGSPFADKGPTTQTVTVQAELFRKLDTTDSISMGRGEWRKKDISPMNSPTTRLTG